MPQERPSIVPENNEPTKLFARFLLRRPGVLNGHWMARIIQHTLRSFTPKRLVANSFFQRNIHHGEERRGEEG